MLSLLPFLAGDLPKFKTAAAAAHGAAGACSGSQLSSTATVALSWQVANPSDGAWQAKIYKDGVLQATQASSSTSFTYTVTGYKEGTGTNQFTSAFVFRVDIVDKITGAVLASSTATTWAQTYSQCPIPQASAGSFAITDPGSCNGTTQLSAMKGTVSWSIANADAANTQIKVFNNGANVATVAGNATSATGITFNGQNQVGNRNCANVTRTFEIRVVKISDGSQVSTYSFTDTELMCDCGGPA